MESENINTLKDKLAGCLIGCAVGDALGVPHEFRFHKKNVYTGELYIIPEFHFQYSHRKDVIGQYSDDTEMTLCSVHSMIESKGAYDKHIFVKNYQKWATTAKALGTNTKELFKGVKTMKGYENRYIRKFSVPESEWGQSNGSLMRCSILSFFGENVVIEDCKLTNPHYINIDCCKVYSLLIRNTAGNIGKKVIHSEIKKMDVCNEVMNVFNDAIKQPVPKRDVTGKSK